MDNEKKYLDCSFLKSSLHFFFDNIRACCSNVDGIVFYKNFENIAIDLDRIFSMRKQVIENINNECYSDGIPDFCQNCCKTEKFLSNKKIDKIENKINTIYFHNVMTCNAHCCYCVYKDKRGNKQLYNVLPVVKELIARDLIAENSIFYMSGGEITISPEFEELFSLLSNYKSPFIEVFTSGIKYSEAIKQSFVNDRTTLIISLDAGSRETYKKIKAVDCFDKVINNIKTYVDFSDNAKRKIFLKYILVDDINDNTEELQKFVNVVSDLGIERIRLDFDYDKYNFRNHIKVPEHYFSLYDEFNKMCAEKNLTVLQEQQCQSILEYSRGK